MIELANVKGVIKSPVDNLYAYVTNMENYQFWFPDVVDITSSDDLPHGTLGKKYQETLFLGENKTNLLIKVKAVTPSKVFYTEGDLEPVLPAMKMLFTELDGNECEFSLSYFSRIENNDSDQLWIEGLSNELQLKAKKALLALQNKYEPSA